MESSATQTVTTSNLTL